MSDEDLPDGDSSKCCTLVETQKVEFDRDMIFGELSVTCTISHPTNQNMSGCFITTNKIQAHGNVYVMNDEGKTIQSISYMISPKDKTKRQSPHPSLQQ